MLGSVSRYLFGVCAALALVGCTQLGLRYASLNTERPPAAAPAITADSLAEWDASKPALRALFAEHVYGTWPEGLAVTIGETRVADANYLDGRGRLEETVIRLGTGEGARVFTLAVAYPYAAEQSSADRPAAMPVVIGQTFSDNCFTFRSPALTNRQGLPCTSTEMSGFGGWAAVQILGRYIAKAPIEDYFDRGIAYANFYAGQIVPDQARAGEAVMQGLRTEPGITASSALSYWGYGYSAAIDMLQADTRIDPDRIGIWGHSRHGKSALVAAAWDERIKLVLAHQSGFGGAALSRSEVGERIDRVVRTYPHWFTPAFVPFSKAPETLPVDQHQLLALLAPRPVFLGNGRRDVWSDPNSTYRAAEAADKIYELYGKAGLDQAGLKQFNPAAQLGFHMRAGAHGTTPEDITALFEFIDAHWTQN